MDELMLKIENVKKEYKLGQIGGTTLRDELQRLWARIRKKEDPTKKIGAKNYNQGEKFLALDGVSFEVKKGERVGIIGHNGAGKSTLLKLISRITSPTGGTISLNGRIASMLEVGTGFHPELTGRENIYMNGAILGMTKKEIDAKMEDIIDFSEVRQFIDTPVKRYSSGMYVKLAFSVAAHLDSEIMIMDEVLAVGDVKFQKKCLDKMNQVSQDEGRTILYVSHNMNTIRQLCDRCIVMDHGQIIFNGDVEKAIEIYSPTKEIESFTKLDLKTKKRYSLVKNNRLVSMQEIELLDTEKNVYDYNATFKFKLTWVSEQEIEKTGLRVSFRTMDNYCFASTINENIGKTIKGVNHSVLEIPLKFLAEGVYNVGLCLLEKKNMGTTEEHDVILSAFKIEIKQNKDYIWSPTAWGCVRLPDMRVNGETI